MKSTGNNLDNILILVYVYGLSALLLITMGNL